MSYCTYEDVGTLLSLTYSTESIPTAVKVTDIISLIASEINMTLKSVGIEIPLSGTDFYNLLKLKNMQGAAGVVGVTAYGNTEDVEGSQGDYYKKEYMSFLTDIKKNPDVYKNTVKQTFMSNQVSSGSATEESITSVMIENDWVP